ncbi:MULTISPECIES: hypothetical protein [Chromohalobacter]|uniref:hypothetical protein n=1 Tax=Chromohalobacter TaxID=42054 RepID=UPI00105CCBE4|nr:MULTISPECIES: hypothetical protein [Chromohalobacter]MCI0510961.1 hypothetical protein [Chromohalobacter sp.]MCI0562098.1 hypothetical protein [Nitrososphaera sp.]
MQTLKEILELVYYVSGPLLVVVAFLALGQIRVAKDQLKAQKKAVAISAKRDALRITAEQISNY